MPITPAIGVDWRFTSSESLASDSTDAGRFVYVMSPISSFCTSAFRTATCVPVHIVSREPSSSFTFSCVAVILSISSPGAPVPPVPRRRGQALGEGVLVGPQRELAECRRRRGIPRFLRGHALEQLARV